MNVILYIQHIKRVYLDFPTSQMVGSSPSFCSEFIQKRDATANSNVIRDSKVTPVDLIPLEIRFITLLQKKKKIAD